MEYILSQFYAIIKPLWNVKVQKMCQILCVKKVPFCKSGHIFSDHSVICTSDLLQ